VAHHATAHLHRDFHLRKMGHHFERRYYVVKQRFGKDVLGGLCLVDGEVSDARAAQGG